MILACAAYGACKASESCKAHDIWEVNEAKEERIHRKNKIGVTLLLWRLKKSDLQLPFNL